MSPNLGRANRSRQLLRLLVLAIAFVTVEILAVLTFPGFLKIYGARITFQPQTLQDYMNLVTLGLYVIVAPICIARLAGRLFDAYFDN